MRALVIAVLKEYEARAKTADLARKHGISEATIHNWKAKFGGVDVSEAKRPKALEEENAKLKKLLAEQMLDAAALRELLSKNGRARRQARCRHTLRIHLQMLDCPARTIQIQSAPANAGTKHLVREQIRSIEKTRAERLERAPKTGPHAMVRLVARMIGIDTGGAEGVQLS